ncbi:DUF4245 domain-containing protein [Homoserinimonas sp. OAct 916]|uniref:DUF4245 domain-containing protein n=1 Tax=Homoserinimonas sp. OAct 916 TaxID=2211450 RepID=UPI000DBE5969|nr:DUF4245 domain-containing protein [Homoserinimonas sp. OAct 916]
MAHEPRVVAELGRPETPEETAARKAQNSKNHRARQTPNNLVLSLLATVGVVILIVLIVPRGDQDHMPDVDYAQVASQAQTSVAETLFVPALPENWTANVAALRTGADDVLNWQIGLLTPSVEYIALKQGLDASPTWLAAELPTLQVTGEETVDGVTWQVYDNRAASKGEGNLQFAVSTVTASSILVLHGTASDQEFHTVQATLADQILAAGKAVNP